MKYLIHYVRNVSSIILCKLTILFSIAALKSEPKISQIIDSKFGFLNVALTLYFQVFSNSQRDFGIFEFSSS